MPIQWDDEVPVVAPTPSSGGFVFDDEPPVPPRVAPYTVMEPSRGRPAAQAAYDRSQASPGAHASPLPTWQSAKDAGNMVADVFGGMANIPGAIAGTGAEIAGRVAENVDPSIDPQKWRDAVQWQPYTPSEATQTVIGEPVKKGMEWLDKRAVEYPAAGAAQDIARLALETAGAVAGVRQGVGTIKEVKAAVQAKADQLPNIPTRDQLETAKTAAYKRATDAGVFYTPEQLSTGVMDIAKDVDPNVHPHSAAVIRRINNLDPNMPLTLDEVENIRRFAGEGGRGVSEGDARRLAELRNALDKTVDLHGQGNPDGVQAIKDARNLYSRLAKDDDFSGMFERAQNMAASSPKLTNYRALQTEFRQLLTNKDRMKYYTPEEQKLIKRVATGGFTENRLMDINSVSHGMTSHSVAAALMWMAGGKTAEGAVLGYLGSAAVGKGSRAAAEAFQRGNLRTLQEATRVGGPNAAPLSRPFEMKATGEPRGPTADLNAYQPDLRMARPGEPIPGQAPPPPPGQAQATAAAMAGDLSLQQPPTALLPAPVQTPMVGGGPTRVGGRFGPTNRTPTATEEALSNIGMTPDVRAAATKHPASSYAKVVTKSPTEHAVIQDGKVVETFTTRDTADGAADYLNRDKPAQAPVGVAEPKFMRGSKGMFDIPENASSEQLRKLTDAASAEGDRLTKEALKLDRGSPEFKKNRAEAKLWREQFWAANDKLIEATQREVAGHPPVKSLEDLSSDMVKNVREGLKGPRTSVKVDGEDIHVKSDNGWLQAQDHGDYVEIKQTNTAEAGRSLGEGKARLSRVIDEFKKPVHSGNTVSKDQARVYTSLAKSGKYTLRVNPHTVNPDTGGFISEDPRVPVFELRAK